MFIFFVSMYGLFDKISLRIIERIVGRDESVHGLISSNAFFIHSVHFLPLSNKNMSYV